MPELASDRWRAGSAECTIADFGLERVVETALLRRTRHELGDALRAFGLTASD